MASAVAPGLSLLLWLYISSFLFLIIILFSIPPLSALPSCFCLSFLWLFQAPTFEFSNFFAIASFSLSLVHLSAVLGPFLTRSLSCFLRDNISVSWRVAVFLRCTVWMTMGSITSNLVMYVPVPLGGLAANGWDFIRFHQPWRHNSPKVTLCLIFLVYVNSMSVPVCNGGFTMRWVVKG